VAPREYPGLTVRAVDVEPMEEDATKARRARFTARRTRLAVGTVRALVDEIEAAPDQDVVAIRGEHRFSRTTRPLERLEGEVRLRSGGVYLITGAHGDVARLVARDLAEHERAKLVLCGRRQLPPRAEWERHLESSCPGAEIATVLRGMLLLEELGAEVLPVVADVTHLDAMKRAVGEAQQRFGALHGVIHCAGVLRDRLMADQSTSEAEEVFTP